MRRPSSRAAVASALLASLALTGCGGGSGDDDAAPRAPADARPNRITTEGRPDLIAVPLATGFRAPTGLVREPGSRGRVLVLERAGTARWLDGRGPATGAPFLDLRAVTSLGQDQGLLGLAFLRPAGGERRIVVLRTDTDRSTVVSTFAIRRGRVDPTSGRVVLRVRPPYGNHRGGQIAVGADGEAYVGLGDGGSSYDPRQYGQNRTTLLGKILRADVTAARPRWRTAAYGVRDPWRMTFDRATGDLWVSDVGEQQIDEIDRVPASGLTARRPPNLGWSAYEGSRRQTNKDLNPSGPLLWPVASYTRRQGCTVVGGVVLRGGAPSGLRDRYLFGDRCSGRTWTVPLAGRGHAMREEAPVVRGQVAWIQDRSDRVLVATRAGTILRLRSGS